VPMAAVFLQANPPPVPEVQRPRRPVSQKTLFNE
jgi:hypothetical protein